MSWFCKHIWSYFITFRMLTSRETKTTKYKQCQKYVARSKNKNTDFGYQMYQTKKKHGERTPWKMPFLGLTTADYFSRTFEFHGKKKKRSHNWHNWQGRWGGFHSRQGQTGTLWSLVYVGHNTMQLLGIKEVCWRAPADWPAPDCLSSTNG